MNDSVPAVVAVDGDDDDDAKREESTRDSGVTRE